MGGNKQKYSTIIAVLLIAIVGIFIIKYLKNNVETTSNSLVDCKEDVSIIEIPNLRKEDEQVLEVQEANLENESFERQGEVAYNGSNKTTNIVTGKYKGLTYYSQADSRWANHKYGNNNMLNSGCGPTAAAMIVSSIIGEITPPQMGDLFVQYGYRSANSGTYWSAFKWVADVFNIEFKQTSSFDTMVNQLNNKNYVVAICKEGLFTYGGHFIVITGVDGDNLKIYDPYLYNGKFNTSTRKGKATVKGNTVYVSKAKFKKYANAQGYFCYKNGREDVKENNVQVNTNTNTANVNSVNYKVKVTAKKGLNIRNGASTSYHKVGAYTQNTIVTITAQSNGWGKTNKGWICLAYTEKVNSNIKNDSKKYTTGTYKITTSVLNVRKGPGTNYEIKTYKQLTGNARNQNKKLGNYYTNGYQKGVICNVSKISGKWGLTPSGWICLTYATKISTNSVSSNSNNYKTGTYQVSASILNVRMGPGINYKAKTYTQLTSNARNQNKKLGNYYTNGYRKGVICNVSKISKNWGLTPSGWINLSYCKKK